MNDPISATPAAMTGNAAATEELALDAAQLDDVLLEAILPLLYQQTREFGQEMTR